jgi:hypothetical protein
MADRKFDRQSEPHGSELLKFLPCSTCSPANTSPVPARLSASSSVYWKHRRDRGRHLRPRRSGDHHAGLLDRRPTRQATRACAGDHREAAEQPHYATGIWLATQKVIRCDFDPAEPIELDMLVLNRWRRDPAQAGVELAELIAELPDGMRDPRPGRGQGWPPQAPVRRAARRGAGGDKAAQVSHEVADAAPASRRTRRTTRTGCSPA